MFAENTTYQVSERQLDRLLEIVRHATGKTRKISNDFGTAEVMPRERDRRDFRNDMSELQNHYGDSVERWIERLKKGEHNPPTPPVVPVLPAPSDMTISDSFVEDSGYTTYYESDFRKAADKATALCSAWKSGIQQSTVGEVTYGQCSGAEQVKLDNGHLGARINGQVKLSFYKLTGFAPLQAITPVFQTSTGYATYYPNDYQKAVDQVLGQCKAWAANLRANSKGVILYHQCGAPKLVKGFNGQLWVTVSASAAYTFKPTGAQPSFLTQQFTNTSGYTTYYPNDIAKAAAQSESQCRAWAQDVLKSSSALPVVVSCAGPEILNNGKIDVRYSGQIVLLPH